MDSSQRENQFQFLSAIIELQQEVATAQLSLAGLMELVCTKTQKLTEATGAVVEMAEGAEMVYQACTGQLQGNLGLRLNSQASLSGLCVKTNEVLNCNDTELDSRVDREACRKVGIRSMICVPLRAGQNAIGVLKVVSPNTDAFSDRHVEVLRLIAGLLSASITQAAEADAKNQALASLSASEKKFRTLIETASEGILISENGRVVEANPAFCQLFGYLLNDLTDVSVTEFVVPELRHQTVENLKSDSDGAYETPCLKKDGTVFMAEAVGKNVELNGRKIRVTTVRDVTVRRQAEEALRQSELKAREATRVKSEFLANISHEIRTPINGVMGMSNLLLDTHIQGEERQYVEIIKRSADSLLTLVNDILDFSKLEANKMSLEIIDFDIHHVVSDICQLLQHLMEQKSLQLKVIFPEKLAGRYEGDPTRLRQILLNLVHNAIKFTDKGVVTIQVSEALLENMDDLQTSVLKFEIQDTGIGIPEDGLAAMFRPFSQVDASTTRKFGGTGLGLSICKQFVDLMHGQIGVHSVQGQGSVFWFQVPLQVCRTSAPKEAAVAEPMALQQKLRILIVEDNAVNQMIAMKMVEKLGHSAMIAANGLEALDALKLAPYDLILMDCQMPEMDGYETTTHIRQSADAKLRQVPIIAMTANVLSGDREKCLHAGMNDYVSKPVKHAELATVLSRVYLTSLTGNRKTS